MSEDNNNTPKRDFSIDMMGIVYGLDSDDIDAMEEQWARNDKPLKEHVDYRRAFDHYAIYRTISPPEGE